MLLYLSKSLNRIVLARTAGAMKEVMVGRVGGCSYVIGLV